MNDLNWDEIGYPAEATRVVRFKNPTDAGCPAWRRRAALRIELKLEAQKRETKLDASRRWRKENRARCREYLRNWRKRNRVKELENG